MNYIKALEYIESTGKFGSKLGLDNVAKLLEILGNPQDKLKIIHVAGTNGKGSTCAYLNSILVNAGYKTGLYTSPFLEEFNERIRINGINIPDDDLAELISEVKEKIDIMIAEGFDHPTEFEIITAAAFLYFSRQNIDFLVLEVGLGGRLDATNVCIPVVSVIASISLDHVQFLGDTLAKIAFEKGGIIKPNIPTVLYNQTEEVISEIKKICQERNSKLFVTQDNYIEITKETIESQSINLKLFEKVYENIELKLLGKHQSKNLLLALTTLKVLEKNGHITEIPKELLYKGILETKWPGRMELISKNPLTIIDGAHNEDGAKNLANTIDTYLFDKKITLVFGMLKDKDVKTVVDILFPKADSIVITIPHSERAASIDEMKTILEPFIECHSEKYIEYIPTIENAVAYAQSHAKEDEAVLYAGSLYMIGDVRKELYKTIKK